MGENTRIEWAHHSWSPWIGCQRVSPGCQNCYAENETFTRVQRSRGRELWGPRGDRHVTSDAYWENPRVWNRRAAELGTRFRVFPSLCDPFEAREDLRAPRARMFGLIEDTPHLDWLLLTKRIENVLGMLPPAWANAIPPHVWIGTSVEDQPRAERRIPELLKIPARIRFLSCEPLLGPVDLTPFARRRKDGGGVDLQWVIIGGESGATSRDPDGCRVRFFDVDWARTLITQCRLAGVPVFMKQVGSRSLVRDTTELPAQRIRHAKGADPAEWPADLRVRELPVVAG